MYYHNSDPQAIAPKSDSGDYPWYAIRVQAKFEKVASAVLREKGYEEFLPLYCVRRQWSDRVKEVELPLFPGYLFCRIDISGRLLPIMATPGVLGIVSAGKTPVPVLDQQVESVQAVLRSGLPAIPWPSLDAGCRVLVERGPLAGLEGVVLNARKKYRLVISVPLLQRAVAVEIDREWVRPLAQAQRLSGIVPLGYGLRHPPQLA